MKKNISFLSKKYKKELIIFYLVIQFLILVQNSQSVNITINFIFFSKSSVIVIRRRFRSKRKGKEIFYLTAHSAHFIYGYMASDVW